MGLPTGGSIAPVNVLALVSDAYGGRGGIARYNRDLLAALARCGRNRRTVVLPRHGKSESAGLPPRLTQLSPRGKVLYPFVALWAAATKGPFDVVFCGHLNLVPLAAIVARILGVPLWLQLHGVEAWGPLTRAQTWAAERALLVTAVSRYTRRRFAELARLDPYRVRVLPNTVDERFAPGAPPPELVDRHDLVGKEVLLTVARLASDERRKGHDKVIRALPAIIAAHPDLVYLIVGEGDDRARLEALANHLGVANHMRFAGQVAPEEMAGYYRLAKVFVMPSIQEGFGIVFLEAAASGLTLIGGDSDGSADALADGVIGISVDPQSPDQLAFAIMTALTGAGPDPVEVQRFKLENFTRHLRDLTGMHLKSTGMVAE